jgi:hypothetical protein
MCRQSQAPVMSVMLLAPLAYTEVLRIQMLNADHLKHAPQGQK